MEPQAAPTYNANTPLRKDKFNTSQLNFLTNFMTLYSAFSANHVPLDAASNAGNHEVIQLLAQPAGSQFQTDIGEISIYCKPPSDAENISLDQGDQIFLRYQGNQTEFQLSAYQIYQINTLTGNGITQVRYFTFLPGKVLLYFGTISCTLTAFPRTPLYLKPQIATNIITANFTVVSSTPAYPPTIAIQTPNENGFYDVIYLVNSSVFPEIGGNQKFAYLILANI